MERSQPNMNLRRVTTLALVLALGVPTVFSLLPGCEETPTEPVYENPFDPLGPDGGGVSLKLDDFGHVNVSCGGVEMGQGLHSALSLTVAEALGLTPERVTINQTDSDINQAAYVRSHATIKTKGDYQKVRFEATSWPPAPP